MAKDRKPLVGNARATDDEAQAAPAKQDAPAKTETPAEMEARIRADVVDDHRAEVAARKEREQANQDAIDAADKDLVEVVCTVSNVHTSKGKITKGQTRNVPEAEADELEELGRAKRA